MPLTELDRRILKNCLQHETGAWNEFVDRFLGLIYHVIHYIAYLRSNTLTAEDVEDLAQEVLLQIVANDYAVLRQFRGNSSLATYLTVIARRICMDELAKRFPTTKPPEARAAATRARVERTQPSMDMEQTEELEKMLRRLPSTEREVVRMFYLERRSYEEISQKLSIPVNSIGPLLSRVRQKLRDTDRTEPMPALPQRPERERKRDTGK